MEVKLGDGFRVTIPKEVRDELNLNKNDLFELKIEDNKIILVPNKNDLRQHIVIPDKLTSIPHVPVEEIEEASKSTLQKTIEKVQYGTKYWENGILKTNIEILEESNETTYECPRCESKINYKPKFLINGIAVCKNCKDKLKLEMIRDIEYSKRIKYLNKY